MAEVHDTVEALKNAVLRQPFGDTIEVEELSNEVQLKTTYDRFLEIANEVVVATIIVLETNKIVYTSEWMTPSSRNVLNVGDAVAFAFEAVASLPEINPDVIE